MKFKLILALVKEDIVERIVDAARAAGATGATVVSSARGEGRVPRKTFLGMSFSASYDLVLMIVEESLCPIILDSISTAGEFDTESGSGLAIQIAVEDAAGLTGQIRQLSETVDKKT